MSVVHKKISEFTDVITGGTPSTSKPEYWDGNIPWLNSGILNDGDVYRPSKFVTELGLKNSAAKLMPPNTVLIALTGATTGQVGYLQIEASANQSVTGILPSKEHHPRYLYYYLMTKKQKIQGDAFGGAQPHINQQYVKDFTIPLPPLDDQIRIATVLTRAELLIAKRKESIKARDELLKSTFLEMFGDPVRNEKGWEILSLKELCEKITDGTHDTPERLTFGVKFITGKHIRPFQIDYSNSDYVTEKVHNEIYKRCNPEFGDVLYTNIGVNLGTAAMNTVNYEFSMKNVALLKPKKDAINSRYLEHILNNEKQKNKIINDKSSGGAQKFLSLGQINLIKISNPPLPLQNQFAAIVEKVESIKAKQTQSLAELENLYASLSQRAFKGELDLSGVEVA